jgi:hypothetical protein
VRGVRYREDTFEGKCDRCGEWWEITPEFWQTRKAGFRRCRACIAECARKAEFTRRRRLGLEVVASAERDRWHHDAEYRERRRAYMAEWRARNRERVRESKRAWYAAHREEQLERARAYHAEARDVILMKQRMRRQERAA